MIPSSSIPPQAKTFLRTFLVVVVGLFVADGADVFGVSVTDLRAWLAAGLAGASVVVLKWLDPSAEASQYGRQPKDEDDEEDAVPLPEGGFTAEPESE